MALAARRQYHSATSLWNRNFHGNSPLLLPLDYDVYAPSVVTFPELVLELRVRDIPGE